MNHAARHLVESLEERGIKDRRVLEAIANVDRAQFLEEDWVAQAWEELALPIALGQTISQPYIVALMTEALELTGDATVLEIGTGSGYQAAILARLCRHVLTIERHEGLSEQAGKIFERASKADTDVRALDETITVTASDGSKTEVTSDPATRSVVIVVVIPENAAPGYEAALAGELRKKMDGSDLSVTVEYVRGYGNSPTVEAGA